MYKVGDKARVKKDLEIGKEYGTGDIYNDHMEEHNGKIVTIKEIAKEGTSAGYYIKEDRWPCPYVWSDEMLEPINEEVKKTMKTLKEWIKD